MLLQLANLKSNSYCLNLKYDIPMLHTRVADQCRLLILQSEKGDIPDADTPRGMKATAASLSTPICSTQQSGQAN